jgi:hypothetical protein
MNQEIRNKLRNVVTQCRKLLEDSISQELEGKYGIFAKKDQVTADPNAKMTHLTEEEQAARKDILDHFGHIKARGFKPKEAFDQLVREIAFTHLNRLCAYKMIEAREVYVGGQKVREAVSRGINSNGVKFYLADHPDEERMFNTGHQDVAYRHFLDWLGGLLSDEIGVLFNPNDPANRLYPRQKTLDEVLDLLNGRGSRVAGGMAEDVVAGRNHRLGLPVFYAQRTAGSGPERKSISPQLVRTCLPQSILHAPLRGRVLDRQHAGSDLVRDAKREHHAKGLVPVHGQSPE